MPDVWHVDVEMVVEGLDQLLPVLAHRQLLQQLEIIRGQGLLNIREELIIRGQGLLDIREELIIRGQGLLNFKRGTDHQRTGSPKDNRGTYHQRTMFLS